MPEHLDRLADNLASNTSRRGFLARVSGALMAAAGGGAVVRAVVPPGEAGAFHLCGHTYDRLLPAPAGMPRIDSRGYPILARDGMPVDDAGRPVDDAGRPLDDQGRVLRDADGRPLPPRPARKLCEDLVSERFGFRTVVDGGWYRCCGGKVREPTDCAHRGRRINGDAALTGYCYSGRKVFCVMYYDTKVPC